MNTRNSIFLVIVMVTPILMAAAGGSGSQPVEFNHNLHLSEVGMDCTDCHQFVERSRKATLPSGELCADCHSELQGESAEEQKLVTMLESEQELDWHRIYVLPSHVYFSHFRHVTLGQIACAKCHGEMKELTSPPTETAVDIIDMDYCMDCHEDRQASNDCLACHN